MMYFLHGLFSGPQIWSSYLSIKDSQALNLYHQNPMALELKSDDIIVGYSLGGRIALDLCYKHKFQIKKLILLSAHPGLEDKDLSNRKTWENEILKKMDSQTKDEFMSFWNSQHIFNNSQDLEVDELTYHKSKDLFDLYRLSKQRNYFPDLSVHHEKIIYIYGKDDQKYQDIAEKLKLAKVAVYAQEGGHRVYQNQEEILRILNKARL
jgi:2-succinyl-6-hydroxy-2,4-cyclohexadiene-1-carboxylate synthase